MTWDYDAIIGFSNGMLRGVELQKKKFKYTNLLDASVALSTLSNFDDNNIITSSKRKILLFNLNNKKISKTYVIQESGNIIGVVKKDNILIVGVENGTVVFRPVKNIRNVVLEKVNAGSNLTCIKQVLALSKFATGGNENPLKIWDFETGKIEFTAKSPKPDMLQLKQPCNVSDIGFFNNNKAVVCHRHGVVELFDPLSSQRRPVNSSTAQNTGFVCLRTLPDYSDHDVIVGSTKGSIYHYDFRGKTTLPVKTFRGSTGSIKSISCINYLSQMHVMSISLDCHVRLHNFTTGDLTLQDYIVAKPLSLIMKPEEN
ncbi:WD repeat-containing protein 74-like [Sipha flava]|uniref:WD repeat-containing protein 74 n=1 Tax=Sipha flava TaxID=143950 RepID=A0A2S2Q124_9HEMI|nr:WD repeat-containing protein 74-like [Sipha flava]